MIPLAWILIAWIACVGVFLLVATLTTSLAVKFALSGPRTVLLCGGFLLVSFIVIGTVSLYSTRVDWSQSLTIGISPVNPSLFQP